MYYINRCLLEEYGKELCRLATEIFKILGPFESNYMSLETGLLRVYRYPRCLEPERTWGIDTHTDSSVLSIIHQDDVGGLQVYKDHQWIDVNPLPNTLIVNIGDMLQVRTYYFFYLHFMLLIQNLKFMPNIITELVN